MNDQAWMLLGMLVLGFVAAGRAIHGRFWGANAKARRRLAAGPTTIADRSVVTLTGVVRPVETLESPLSGTPCVAYVAWAKVGTTHWAAEERPPFSSMKMLPFELVTQDGVVLVDATIAEIAFDPRPAVPRQPERERKFLTDLGQDARRLKLWSFHQIMLQEGDSIRVQGMAVVDQVPPDESDHYRKLGQKVRLVHHEAHPLTIGPAR